MQFSSGAEWRKTTTAAAAAAATALSVRAFNHYPRARRAARVPLSAAQRSST